MIENVDLNFYTNYISVTLLRRVWDDGENRQVELVGHLESSIKCITPELEIINIEVRPHPRNTFISVNLIETSLKP